jgi:hypothetical protein
VYGPPDTPTVVTEIQRDLSFLLVSENFHPIPNQDVPPPFRQTQAEPSTPIVELLSRGLFRAAAQQAALQLTASTPPSQEEIFKLIYIRLTCLTLLGHVPLAGQESRCLQDITSPFYVSEYTKKNILPWDLRVLATRLQATGFGDVRRAVSGYYDLARSARTEIVSTSSAEDKSLWKARLADLGIRVANVLVEIGDIGAATRHLDTLNISGVSDAQRELIRGRLGLLYLRVGKIAEARRFITGDEAAGSYAEVLRPLLSIAEGNYSSAAKQLEVSSGQDVTSKNNMAVALVYAGEMKKAREVLESMIDAGGAFPVLLFNLATIFELSSEKARTLKANLVEEVAQLDGGVQGWEKSMQDFKL